MKNMKNSHVVKIKEWIRNNNLRKKEYIPLLECFHRINMFRKDNDDKKHMLLLAFPSEARPLKERGFIKPSSSEIKKALNWYDLTDIGYEVIQRLDLKWSEKEMNEILFNSSENRIV